MCDGAVCVGRFTVVYRAVNEDLVFSDEIDHVKAEVFNALVTPEVDNLEQLSRTLGLRQLRSA